MKNKYLIGKVLILLALVIGSCKQNEVTEPTFDATVLKTTYKVGEQVPFVLAGNPDFVSFYSGEFGNDYAYIGGRNLDIKSFSMSFQSRVLNGTQKNQFTVHISSNFNGKYDIASVKSATWTDITSSFTLATADYINSGEVDLTPMVTDKTKPLYIAFRYITLPQTTANGTQRNWTVRSFSLNTKTDQGANTALDQISAAWSLVEDGAILEAGRNLVSASSGIITLRGNAGTTEAKNSYTEAWAISKGVDLNTIILGPDKSIPIKGISETMQSVYNYAYSKPGIYKAVFAVSNSTVYGQKPMLKEIMITVEP